MSETIKGKVLKLFISLKGEKKRQFKETIFIDELGVEEDKFYAKDINRLILITSTDAYKIAKDNQIELEHGDLGENILIDGNINHLNVGDRFSIGEATLEITQNCTLCNGLSLLDPKLPKVLKDDRGIFAKAVNDKSGIKIGDVIKI
jgi:MOSC domain-containing protein YiiM